MKTSITKIIIKSVIFIQIIFITTSCVDFLNIDKYFDDILNKKNHKINFDKFMEVLLLQDDENTRKLYDIYISMT